MSIVATRMPLETIGMNSVAASPSTRRSARLSAEAQPEEDARKKKSRHDTGRTTAGVTPSLQDGGAGKRAKRRKDYDQESDGFVFTKSKRAKSSRENAVTSASRDGTRELDDCGNADTLGVIDARHTTQKPRRQFPTTPERQSPRRRAAVNQSEAAAPKSPFKPAHAQSHANAHRSPSPHKGLTVEKKRRKQDVGQREDGRPARIMLPASDTPVILRNKAMRQSMLSNNDRRRSSAGMRGRRVSSLMDEGKSHAMPHSDVVTSEFFTHITPDLTEPRRMRLLLGWCGVRALPPKAQAPPNASKEASEDFQASQAARVIQEELCKELSSNGALSEWFSRDTEEPPPKIVLRKKPNPRNIANAAKADELERELERLKLERQAWDEVSSSADQALRSTSQPVESKDGFSPIHPDLLSSPQRGILEQLNQSMDIASTDPAELQQRLQDIATRLEPTVDNFAHSVHAINATRDLAERLAQQSNQMAAQELEKREREQAISSGGRKVDALDALRGLAKVLNAKK